MSFFDKKFRIYVTKYGRYVVEEKVWWNPFWVGINGEWTDFHESKEDAEKELEEVIRAEIARKAKIENAKKLKISKEYTVNEYIKNHPEKFL